MDQFICQHLFIPLRTAPSHRAEMGSQILFGERYEIVDTAGSYSRIRLLFDDYHGWIDNDHVNHIEADSSAIHATLAEDTLVRTGNNPGLILPAGSELYNITSDRMEFTSGTLHFRSSKPLITAPLSGDPVSTATRYLNIPYLWGGRTYMGMDCSGLVQTVYKVHGVSLPRDSFLQAKTGRTINMLSEALPGDLLFFDNKQGRITHVGMLHSEGTVIHCSGSVRLDMIDHQGIFRRDINRYTHRLRIIRRVL